VVDRRRGTRTRRLRLRRHRILAAYGGIFVAGSLAWGVIVDKFQPDRWDYLGATLCLVGVAVIMYAPRH
jgi:small multidrug resistance family-3 protein